MWYIGVTIYVFFYTKLQKISLQKRKNEKKEKN
jgi:hypothetical protein